MAGVAGGKGGLRPCSSAWVGASVLARAWPHWFLSPRAPYLGPGSTFLCFPVQRIWAARHLMVLGDHFEASPGASATILLLLSGQNQRPGLSCPLSLQPVCSPWTLTVPCPLPAAGQKSCACFPLHTPEFFPPQRHTEQPTCAWGLAFLSPSQGGEALCRRQRPYAGHCRSSERTRRSAAHLPFLLHSALTVT